MENKPVGVTAELDSNGKDEHAANGRRRRNSGDGTMRYFLPKPGSSPERPELGREMPTEGEALIEAFRNGQLFFVLIPYKATTEVKGGSPLIVKQAVGRT